MRKFTDGREKNSLCRVEVVALPAGLARKLTLSQLLDFQLMHSLSESMWLSAAAVAADLWGSASTWHRLARDIQSLDTTDDIDVFFLY